ncbi:S-layer protein [Campylobacter fetus subsp. fetus]|uniref:S-layer protein n=5 Tax=Campylobacter fetus TaxID=196 RepID=UPI000DA2F9BE|nr:S-layer protein [Campylobacter fetus]QYA64613.1 S-layer protein [Campylobacter fetus subsp. fetus]SQH29826.1 surface array protein [Campylobacter fetus subsp. fetus]
MISKSEVSELFIVLFGRPTEGEGNTYWVNESSANGWGMIETSNAILNLDITKSFLGETLNNNESFVKHLFKNAVNLTEFVSDEQKAGLKYWVDLLDNGTVSKADLVGHFVNAAKDPSNAGANQDLFNNKVIVSNYVADTIAKLPLDGLTPDQQNALIQKTVDIINNVTSNSSSVESAKGEVDALKSELPNPGSTYDLTEGNDNLKGTDLDDTFNGTVYLGTGINKSTLTAFDTVDGAAGNDTINISFGLNSNSNVTDLKTSDLNSALLGVTNVEKLNIISEVKAADGGGLTINGYKSVSLNIVGETKIADTDATKLDIKASGNVTVTKAEAVKDLSINAANSEVSIAANATKALENLTIKNASKLTATNAFDGDTLKSVTLSNVTLGDTNAAAAFDFKGVSTLNFDNVVSAQTADSKIAHITSSAETLNLNLSGKTATVALATNSVTKVANINANADVNAFLITKANGEMNPGHADLQNDSFTTFIVKGNGKELTLNAGDLDLVKDIDTTGFSGNAKVSFGDTDSVDGSQLSVKTGAGNDTLNLEAKKLKAGSLIDGGEGNDTIIMKASALADAATLGMIKNIENVTVSDALSANTDVSASSFVNIGLLADNTGGGNDVVLTINKDQIVDIQTAKLAENKKVTIKLNDATGADDTVNIVLNAKAIIGADKSVTVGANDAAKALIINKDIETVNITSVTKDSTTDNKLYMKVAEGAEGANKVIITGDAATTLAAGGVAASDLKTIKDLDASALTGKLTFDASVNKLASGATIKGGSGDDSITVGYDTQVVTLGAGDDTVVLKAGNADIAKYSTITDFSKGDKIDISQLKANTKNAATSISKADELASTATFKEQVEAILKSDGSNTAVAKYFQFGGDTYIVVDTANAATSTITADTDGIIKLAGFTGDLTIDGSSIITVA